MENKGFIINDKDQDDNRVDDNRVNKSESEEISE